MKRITAQAMVEFALALPILLLIVYGLLETGRLIFIYASVVTAARQAARYGAASGDIGTGTLYYNDCNGIRGAANRVAFIQSFSTIDIAYDTGPTSTATHTCPYPGSPITDNDHRIDVTVTSQWVPIVSLVPLRPFAITSISSRTILTGVAIDAGNTPSAGGGQLTVAKTGSPATYNAANQTIAYTYVVANPGTDPVTNISLTDDKATVTCPGGMGFTLAGGGSSVTCTANYVTTQANVNAEQDITNTVTALGSNSLGFGVTGTASFTVTFDPEPQLTLTKSGVAPSLIAVGQVIQYTFALQNTGNVTLGSPFNIADAVVGSNWSCPGSSLAAGASMNCTGTYSLTNADINRGYVDNSAQANAQYSGNTVYSNTSTTRVITPRLFLSISADKASVSVVNEVITFTYTVKNRTGATITNISLSNTLANTTVTEAACKPIASLAAGATATCHGTHTVTQADLDAGSALIDTSQATSGTFSSNLAGVTITVLQNAALTLAKSASPDHPASGNTFTLPTTITYTYTLTNSGNVTLSAPFGITDDKLGVLTCTGFSTGTLAVAGTRTCTATYSLVQADLDAGSLINHATATGIFNSQTITSNVASATVITFTQARLGYIKTANITYFTGANQSITYTYTLKNTGGVALTVTNPYKLSDTKIGSITCGSIGSIAIGASVVCKTAGYTTTAADVTAKAVTNTVTAGTGNTITPAITNTPSATLTIPLFICTSSTVTGSGAIPNTSGSPATTTWTINNGSGLPIHISSLTLTWTPLTTNLNRVVLNGTQIFNGTGASGIVLPGAPFTLINGANPFTFTFSAAATTVRAVVTFSEQSCNFVLQSSP
ncbi:MAG TPA: TadE/TadG family type IV pilus assembly protein [Anaerolineales bacterium]|nr:TadE/TadG family type IV pilus assembly protein [Anaerolineales bacterium]